MARRKPLAEEMRDFRHSKMRLIPILIIGGLIGLVLPVIPGLALILLGLLLLFPGEGERFLNKIRGFLGL